jgi:hypothetical protein
MTAAGATYEQDKQRPSEKNETLPQIQSMIPHHT